MPSSTDSENAARPARWDDWRWQTRHRVRTLAQLRERLDLAPHHAVADDATIERFPLGVTPYYLSLADPADPADPILRQVLPVADEAEAEGQETGDPFREDELSPVKGVVHRYGDRALILPTNYCATLCRHCFRKRTWSDGFFVLSRDELRRAVDYVAAHDEIRDVLVTGGDPLNIALPVLDELLGALRAVPHVEVLRVASRVPVTLPQRIDAEMVARLAAHRPLWLVTHFNHARELAPPAARALRALLDAGISVLNQTVLLRGVNDSVEAQLALARGLIRLGVRPYYLHMADPVAGAGHFRLPLARGVEIVKAMHGRIAGFGIPRLVVDLPDGKGKVPLGADFVLARQGEVVLFESPIDGSAVAYRDPRRES